MLGRLVLLLGPVPETCLQEAHVSPPAAQSQICKQANTALACCCGESIACTPVGPSSQPLLQRL